MELRTEESDRILNNPGHKAKKKTPAEVKGMLEFMPEPPNTIAKNEEAMKVWHDVLPTLIERNVIHSNDLNGFILYCLAMSTFTRAAAQLADDELMKETRSREGEVRHYANPLLAVMANASGIAERWAKHFGLTPLSRDKVKGSAKPKKSAIADFVKN